MGGRLTDGRPAASQGPRAARSRPVPPAARRGPAPVGRVRRFARRHGWRAYALPLLALATIAVLVDLALHPPVPAPAASSEPGAAPPSAMEVAPIPPVRPAEPAAPAEGDVGPTETAPPATVEEYVEQGAGTLSVVDGGSAVSGSGPLQRFVVEVEDGIGVDGAAFADAVTATLADPRSWGNGGRMSFQRVGVGAEYDFKVSLVSPGSMEIYCPGVGTGGYTSCRYGERAVINLARWATAVPHYDGDLATYRPYVVNHEVGHALGNGHQPCPGPGQLAPVMQQQTLGLEGCVKNAWPYP
ncbi:DUF3152 domain-containing protein [Blastococcus capsensis]|uniref:DUF3152 domain-containing protein n=1 Tax=Blastococcus capsensis TaxID=1564163 RepID=UPI00253FE399|nr:DUF3152 domain-containing protein [Blastococcus capsensis]MDK3256079.1 DUF3152 domain-containing protein [Blastococcus capsensis]